MTSADGPNRVYETSVKLCAAVKKYKCLHNQVCFGKYAPTECEEAWEMVAEECDETIDFCKNRWKNLRRSFFEGLKRRGSKYYLHDYLEFLLKSRKKTKSQQNSEETYNVETNSASSDALQKVCDNSLNLQEDEGKPIKMYDGDEVKSISSQTTSADESNEILQPLHQTAGVFIINELEDGDGLERDFEEDRRLSYNRSCKRALDPELIDELAKEEPEEKRYRKSDRMTNKTSKERIDKLKINVATNKVEIVKGNVSIEGLTSTDTKETLDVGIQYEVNTSDFDEIFMQSIKTQLQEMNPRQKMNFKRKIYQSLLEVFDDANDFPNSDGTSPYPQKQAPCVVNATTGELRLIRELAALVQAAKVTPEIINAKEKINSSTPVENKTPPKMTVPNVESRSRIQMSPLSVSPTPDDDDLQILSDDIEDEETTLPRSWDEIKAKASEHTNPTSPDIALGIPRRVLQKVVRVAGSNGSTIITRDGDKKRVYRIVPKLMNHIATPPPTAKYDSSVGRFIVSNPKNPQDVRKENSNVGTFYVTNTKITPDTSKTNGSTSNFPIRPVNIKATINSNQTSNSVNNPNQTIISNTNFNTTNGQTIFKNVHPANRILSSSTGYFKMVPSTKTITPPPKQQSSSLPSTSAASNSTCSKVMTAKIPVRPMLPPNVTTKRVQTVRAGPQILQRRYSICGPLPPEKSNTPPSNSTADTSKGVAGTNNGNAPINSTVSKIQISQPISLNAKAKALNSQTTISQNIPSNLNAKNSVALTTSPKDIKFPVQATQKLKESHAKKEPSARNDTMENTLKGRVIPILETAGTVEADDLDPLFVKPPQVKTEPIDE